MQVKQTSWTNLPGIFNNIFFYPGIARVTGCKSWEISELTHCGNQAGPTGEKKNGTLMILFESPDSSIPKSD